MSKQANEVRKTLDLLHSDYTSEIDISKIVKSPLHKGIIVDFYIESLNCVIEVHGIQHEKPQSFSAGKLKGLVSLNRQLDRDSRLRNICSQFGVNYVEVWYNEKIDITTMYKKLEGITNE
jgi:hypothetical protein